MLNGASRYGQPVKRYETLVKIYEEKLREAQSSRPTPPAQVAPTSAPSSAAIVQYITGDKTYKGGLGQDSYVDVQVMVLRKLTTNTYHLKTEPQAVRAYKFLTSRGIQVTEFEGYTPVGSHSAKRWSLWTSRRSSNIR